MNIRMEKIENNRKHLSITAFFRKFISTFSEFSLISTY